MNLAFYAPRLLDKAIGKLHIVVYPPLRSTLDVSGVYVEAAAQT